MELNPRDYYALTRVGGQLFLVHWYPDHSETLKVWNLEEYADDYGPCSLVGVKELKEEIASAVMVDVCRSMGDPRYEDVLACMCVEKFREHFLPLDADLPASVRLFDVLVWLVRLFLAAAVDTEENLEVRNIQPSQN